jgi:transcriptional regulator with XRE-family HTH domain
MCVPEKSPLAKWLENKYLEWQTKKGERKTISEFADYLDVNRSLLSFWMNGARIPNEENIIKIAEKLGFEIYDVLDMERPNPLHFYVDRNWHKLPPQEQRKIAELISKHTNEPLPEPETKPSKI